MNDEYWLSHALKLAKQAADHQEVPIGAVLVKDNQLIGEGWNQPISSSDPTAHAEIVALRQGAQTLGNYRLVDTTLYVTLEPCAMCAGAMVHARVKRLVFGAFEPRAGAVKSIFQLLDDNRLNHRVAWEGGVMAEECGHVLKAFFQQRR